MCVVLSRRRRTRTSRCARRIGEQVVPGGIRRADEGELFCAAPALQLLLASDRGADVVGGLDVHEPHDPVLRRREYLAASVHLQPAGQVVGHADVQAARSTGKDVRLEAAHVRMLARRSRRTDIVLVRRRSNWDNCRSFAALRTTVGACHRGFSADLRELFPRTSAIGVLSSLSPLRRSATARLTSVVESAKEDPRSWSEKECVSGHCASDWCRWR